MSINLTNSQYDKIMNEYQMLRSDAELVRRNNTIEAYNKIPELKDLDKKLIESMRNLSSEEFSQISKDIEEEKKRILKEHSFPSDFLTIKYNCNECEDTGFIGDSRCKCFKNKIIKLVYGSGRWPNLFHQENFDTFDISLYSDTNAKESAIDALSKSKTFVSEIINDSGENKNLFITGNTGVGKTFLCNCIAKELIENGKYVVYLSAPALFELFERVTFGNKKSFDEYSPEISDIHFRNLFDCDLLIIDDLGTECINNFTKSKLLDLINKRLLGYPTLISTNLSMEGIKVTYSERFFSRIVGNYSFIHLYGDDIRYLKR